MKRISTGLLYAFAAAMILLLAAGAPALAAAKIIYVDSSGNDTSGTGGKDAPFKTIEDAFDYAKTNKSTLGVESTMDVTLVTSGDIDVSPQPTADEETPQPAKKKSGGGGGGCDMTGSIASAALMLIFAQLAKRRKRS